jgi:hypothetical protein
MSSPQASLVDMFFPASFFVSIPQGEEVELEKEKIPRTRFGP